MQETFQPSLRGKITLQRSVRATSLPQVVILFAALHHLHTRLKALRREIRAAHPYVESVILYLRVDSGDFEYPGWKTQLTQ